MRRSVNYETGERLTAEAITNVPLLTRYAQQEIGVNLPLGNGRRQGWSKFVKDEMKVQGWSIRDLVITIKYIKATNKQCNTPHGILWYVKDAKEWNDRAVQHTHDGLHMKVAETIELEVDESWARRLSLAKGKALELVYANWLVERG